MTFYPQVSRTGDFDIKLQARLNREYDEATKTRFRNEGYNIRPQLEQYRTLEEEKADLTYQFNLARKNLSTILKPEVVNQVLQAIDDDRIYTLNSYWKAFKDSLKGQTNITKDAFVIALDRFEKYLANTQGTLVDIPLSDQTISLLPDAIYQKWLDWAQRKIDPLTDRIINIEDLLRETSTVVSKSADELKQEVQRQMAIKREYSSSPTAEGELQSSSSPTAPKRTSQPILRGPPPALASDIKKATAKIAQSNQINEMYPELGVMTESDTTLTPEEASTIYNRLQEAGLSDALNTKQTRILIRPFGRTISRKADIKGALETVFSTGGSAPPRATTEGSGVRKRRSRVVHGSGVGDRYKLLVGELDAGNIAVLPEIKSILQKLKS